MWLGGSLFQQLGSPSRAEAPGCAPTAQSEPHLPDSGASLGNGRPWGTDTGVCFSRRLPPSSSEGALLIPPHVAGGPVSQPRWILWHKLAGSPLSHPYPRIPPPGLHANDHMSCLSLQLLSFPCFVLPTEAGLGLFLRNYLGRGFSDVSEGLRLATPVQSAPET